MSTQTGGATVLGFQKAGTRISGNVIHILCECGRTTPILHRELDGILQKNSLKHDTEVSSLILEDCGFCKKGGKHKLNSKEISKDGQE